MPTASVLVVDDDPILLDVVCRALRDQGYQAQGLEGGGEALRRLRQAPVDILITDILMPDVDGIELIGHARRLSPAIKILAITGRGQLRVLNLLDLAERIGADRTLAKPFTTEQLMAALEALTASDSEKA
ncbi:MAG TPA: response regulator [Caulobacteraceae bacterium]|jgi:CheY-like chemotaxis protein|nr:response regulator [Caulobacteraceae bacterium]